ncbi:MAG: HypC/HybG/HupF family hydrogenase formation chaperone [Acidimicrobiia bacterium]
MVPGVVEFVDQTNDVNLVMVPDVSVGAYVVVHSGYAIRVVPASNAETAIRLLSP